ncbi:MAG TPA: glutamine synthetase family protein [Steroidobacteraceae bacterium]|nr:glutamine synthetase family protein [Steroidobacteraceae bacterium]
MEREQIVFVGTSDLSAHFRGKSFPAADLPARLERGVGLAPTNLFISAFGPIHVTPFGTVGEVFLIPDPATKVFVPFAGGTAEYFFLGDIKNAQGKPWELCPRQALRRALDRLEAEAGVRLLAAFEQEFTYGGAAGETWQPYDLSAYRRQGPFGEALLAAMRLVGVIPDSFLAEFGREQYEVTVAPALGLKAADDAVITRQLVHAVAFRLGQRASFTPIPEPEGTGNGTHVHFSFLDPGGRPVLYDERRPWQLSPMGSHFIAGIQHHLPALCAITAPSVASYLRLRPNRWAPVRADAAPLDRGAAIRISPLSGSDAEQRARQFNIEFRVADATANPYLTLAMLVQAGLDGVRRELTVATEHPPPLPTSLKEALARLETSEAAGDWLGPQLASAYVLFKRAEVQVLDGLEELEICRRYGQVY